MTTDSNPPKIACDGIVLYSDGGCKPNPGYAGWGFHGYAYKNEPPKKGTGCDTHLPTAGGYVSKLPENKSKEVTPVAYLDGFGTIGWETNNAAEIAAATNAFKTAFEKYDFKEIKIRTDSSYAISGSMQHMHAWAKNGWIKADGTEPKNVEFWKKMYDVKGQLENAGIKVQMEWIKGHTDKASAGKDFYLGNVKADKLATAARLNCTMGHDIQSLTVSQPEGYWKKEVDRHPFIFNKRCYFNTLVRSHIPGEYLLGDHGKDDELLGTRVGDGAYSVVQLMNPDPVIELVRSHQTKQSGDVDTIVMIRLDKLFNPTIYKEFLDFGEAAMIRANPSRLDLLTLDEEPLTREFRPPGLAMRAVHCLSQLKALLSNYRMGFKENITVNDVTDVFYETEVTKKKDVEVVTKKLKSQFVVGFSSLSVDVNYVDRHGKRDLKVKLSLGIDIAERNALKRLEAFEPKVNVLVWSEAPDVIRYATVIEAQGSYLISAGMYSNIIYLDEKKPV